MLLTTTPSVEGFRIKAYLGVVDADSIMGANVVRDFFASVSDVIGGRVTGYEKTLGKAKRDAMASLVANGSKLGANAIIGIDLDYETIQVEGGGSMMMVSATGTAVRIEAA